MCGHPHPSLGSPLHSRENRSFFLGNALKPLLKIISVHSKISFHICDKIPLRLFFPIVEVSFFVSSTKLSHYLGPPYSHLWPFASSVDEDSNDGDGCWLLAF